MELKEVSCIETKNGLLRLITLTTYASDKEKDRIAWKHSEELKEYFNSIENKMNIQNVYAVQQNPNEVITFIWYYI